MKHNILLILILLISSQVTAYEYAVKQVSIEAYSDNKDEAKAQAFMTGITRSFVLSLDKMSLSTEVLRNLKYSDISSTLISTKIYNDHYDYTDNTYRANMDIIFDAEKLYNLIFQYGDAAVRGRMNKFILIPILKLGQKFYNDPSVDPFLATIYSHYSYLESNKIIIPSYKEVKYSVSKTLVEGVEFTNLTALMEKYFAWQPIILIAEYTTNLENTKSTLDIKYLTLYSNHTKVDIKHYLLSDKHSIYDITQNIIADLVKKFGSSVSGSYAPPKKQ